MDPEAPMDSKSRIERLMECPICLDKSQDPRLLQCGHTLCRECLQNHIAKSAQGSHFKCPSCRYECVKPVGKDRGKPAKPEEVAVAMPKNYLLNSLMDMVQQSQREAFSLSRLGAAAVQERHCANYSNETPHTTATVFCEECAQFYCSSCKSRHQEHRLRPAEKVHASDVMAAESRRKTSRCQTHPDQLMDMYCDTCSVPACLKCCLCNHQNNGCTFLELTKKARESNKQLEDLERVAIEVVASLDKQLRKQEDARNAMKTKGDDASEKIKGVAAELKAEITAMEKSMLKTIDDTLSIAQAQANAAYETTEMENVVVHSLLSYIQSLRVSGDALDQVVHTPGLQEQVHQTGRASQKLVTLDTIFETMNLTVRDLILAHLFGTVTVKAPPALGSGPGLGPVRTNNEEKIMLRQPNALKPDLGRWGLMWTTFISGLVVCGDWLVAIGWCKPILWISNTKMQAEKTETLAGLEAVGMAVVSTSGNNYKLVITDKQRKVHFVTFNLRTMNITGRSVTERLPFEPRQVSVDSVTQKLIIANTTDNQVVVCDNTGHIETRVKVKTDIKDLSCALSTGVGYVVLDNSHPGRIHWVNRDGVVTHTYGKADGESLNCPNHMALDSQGRLVVADRENNRLHLIDVNQKLSQYLLTKNDGLKLPHFVCLDESTGETP